LKRKNLTRIIGVRIEPQCFDKLERLRRETGAHTVSEVVRSIIEQAIKEVGIVPTPTPNTDRTLLQTR
jgi:predicted DNA-binding protein